MNILLFVPFGMSLPYLLQNSKHAVLFTILIALAFSFSIELLQFCLARGESEVDDLIFNSLGTMIGTLSFIIYKKIRKC